MTHDQLFVFRDMLNGQMDQIQARGMVTAEAIKEVYQACPDLNDRASLESERQMLILLGQRERNRKHQISAALSRINEGCYGKCQGCGEDIPFKRLEVQPTTTLCVCCQEELERGVTTGGLAWA